MTVRLQAPATGPWHMKEDPSGKQPLPFVQTDD